MATFYGGNGAFTPATNADNYVLDADAVGDCGRVKSISWGGRQTTAGSGNAYRTRWTRPTTNATSTFTSLTPGSGPPTAAATCRLGTFATAAVLATDPAGNLWAVDWNSFGGGGAIIFNDADAWQIVFGATAGLQQIACRNVAGVEASTTSYTVSWAE